MTLEKLNGEAAVVRLACGGFADAPVISEPFVRDGAMPAEDPIVLDVGMPAADLHAYTVWHGQMGEHLFNSF